MSEEPRVTVLIGCWNNADTLERAARSILGQTIRGIELIVVDDGSTDDTHAVVESLADERARRLALPHMGISRSLNEGLRAARAPLVAIQDADDWSEPERLERQVAVLDQRQEVAVVGCRMREVDELGRELVRRTSFAPGDVNEELMHFNPIPNSCACFRRDLVIAAGAYDLRYRYAMDYDLWLRLAEHHVVVALDEVLATRRMSSTNVAARKERAQIRETIVMRTHAMLRRRSVRGLTGIVIGILAWAAPLPLKRALRRARGQAP